MKLWYGILLVILTLSLTGCGGSSNSTDLQNYLSQLGPLVEEVADLSSDLDNLVEDVGPFGLTNLDQKLAPYSTKYAELQSRCEAIKCPEDAVKLRGYTMDLIYSNKQMIDEMLVYIDTRDRKHFDLAESYFMDAEKSRRLAGEEWDRLSDSSGKENGISIIQIFLGLLALGVAVSIAMFVLQLTLGAGVLGIAGITTAIEAIIRKIKGKPEDSNKLES